MFIILKNNAQLLSIKMINSNMQKRNRPNFNLKKEKCPIKNKCNRNKQKKGKTEKTKPTW